MALPLVAKIAPVVDVTPPFNDYETFIKKVRDALAGTEMVGPASGTRRPVLKDKETAPDKQPLRWIHVHLNGKRDSKPTVAIRSDNAYIMGFTNSAGRWFQLSKTGTTTRLVDDNPVMAGFDGNYNTLVGGADNLTGLNLNKFSVADAAANLWKHKANLYGDDADGNGNEDEEAATLRDDNDIKKAVAKLAVAICEAARFIGVSDVIKKGWSKDEGVKITLKEVRYIKNWEDLSKALLLWRKKDYTPDDENIFKDLRTKAGISNGKEALDVVALVKLLNVKQNTMAGPTDEQLLAYAELPKLGRYMAEVFAVRVPAAAGGGHPPLRGTISFHGGHYCSGFLYSHEGQDSCCDSQGNIVLTGPWVAISAYSPIVFSLDLHDGSRGSSSQAAGRIVCDAGGGDFCSYDKAITETVETGYGPAEVTYAVLTNGVQGRVAVKLLRLQPQQDDEDGSGVLGRVVARSKLFDDVGCVLFYNDDANNKQQGLVRVPPGELLLPLARQALAVPLHMPLTVQLDLRSSSSGDEIANGELEFNPAIEGQQTQSLVGVNGTELQVTISWSEYPW